MEPLQLIHQSISCLSTDDDGGVTPMMTFSSFLLSTTPSPFFFFPRRCHTSDASVFFLFPFFFGIVFYDHARFWTVPKNLSGAAELLLYYSIYIPSLPIHPIIPAQL
ncbi:hypothetical protein BDV38DRAFT_236224 [Aspergillus pseudotamarii]|uniref:Uncharacterized protein n=1 Tax=Aspergillus pseudotamarii TaxID=132259 RepID=A0A5N6T7T1_ASPPS|nr:uncharacterized protein BDV38DRAFT_236224 [Aspergillus pseudotamarii]KAE8142259.1 hypothetical protein BDV38DRAFT_236224 [Aspergillus pseudotamarii]